MATALIRAAAGRLARTSCLYGGWAVSFLAAVPASAGIWVNGGTYDMQQRIAVSFLRFLAEVGEGQMIIRCDPLNGLWVDAGVAGTGIPAEGIEVGTTVDVTLAFVRAAEVLTVTIRGEVVVRGDGAVLASMIGRAVAPLGTILLEPAERVDITIGDVTRPVPLGGLLEDLRALADRCTGWPAARP